MFESLMVGAPKSKRTHYDGSVYVFDPRPPDENMVRQNGMLAVLDARSAPRRGENRFWAIL